MMCGIVLLADKLAEQNERLEHMLLVKLEYKFVMQIDQVRVARVGQRIRNEKHRAEQGEQQLEKLIVTHGALAE